jgi:hypothetical protein
MDPMREIIDEGTVEKAFLALALVGPLLGLAGGAWLGVARKRMRFYVPRGLAVGCLGVLNWGLWRFYSYRVRYDPQSQYFGLEKVSVLVLNLLIFTLVGGIIGLLWARFAPSHSEENPSSQEEEKQKEKQNAQIVP